MEYCRVIVDGVPFVNEEGFTYHIPAFLQQYVELGSIVYVPFGKNDRIKKGFVIEADQSLFRQDKDKIKEILMIHQLEPAISSEMMDLCRFVSEYYACALIYAIKQVVPKYVMHHPFVAFLDNETSKVEMLDVKTLSTVAKKSAEGKLQIVEYEPCNENKQEYYEINRSKSASPEECLEALKRSPKQKKIFEFILTNQTVSEQSLKDSFKNYRQPLQNLMKKNMVVIVEPKEETRCFYAVNGVCDVKMTFEQTQIFDALVEQLERDKYSKSLINGVTGSGKTLIYEEIAEEVLRRQRQILFLVPEIALSQQLYLRLKKRFGERIALLHSQLTEKERYLIWEAVAKHKIDIVLGPRSALFLPFSKLGLIIIDEEHESSYKQSEPDPRYHAIKVAEYLAARHNALLVLGSATPSVETLYEVIQKKCMIYNLPERVNKTPLPDVRLINMLEERKTGNKAIISESLAAAMKRSLENNEQIILLINKKGYSSYVICHECGEVVHCPKCDIPLTYYQSSNELKCNYCEFHMPMIKSCPNCGSEFIEKHGIGTESVEEECTKLFPSARIDRLDAHALMNKSSREQILVKYQNHDTDILVGTQLLAKGLDFMNTTCIGVINADMTLNLPDFRSSERCFQLMVQVAGRAGRDNKPSTVYIQTYQKEHYAMQDAVRQNVHQFFLDEIAFRKQWLYPPYVRLCRIIVSDYSINDVEKSMATIYNYIARLPIRKEIIGPSFAPLNKKNNRYRMHLILKTRQEDDVQGLMKKFRMNLQAMRLKKSTRVLIDVDPENIF